ncbi:MAG: hypothetical protein WD993_03985 [Thermoleophilaceae bacterium]
MTGASDDRRLRVLLGPTDPAGVACNLGQGLQELGHTVEVVVWEPSPFGYRHDVSLGSAWKRLRYALGAGRTHDVLHMFGGRSVLPYLDLVTARARRRLPIVQYNGTDARCSGIAAELHPARARIVEPGRDRNIRVHRRVAGRIAHAAIVQDLELVSYLVGSYRSIYVMPFAIDLPAIDRAAAAHPPVGSGSALRVLHAPSNRRVKGSDRIEASIRAAAVEVGLELVTVSRAQHSEVLAEVGRADLVVDQLNSETPGVLAAEAMALGKPVLVEFDERKLATFARPTPAVPITADNLAARLIALARDPAERASLGESGKAYARAVHAPVGAARAAEAVYRHVARRQPGIFEAGPDGVVRELDASVLRAVLPQAHRRDAN